VNSCNSYICSYICIGIGVEVNTSSVKSTTRINANATVPMAYDQDFVTVVSKR
jgi:hypothetical protein